MSNLKFTLSKALHRVQKVDICLDVIIEGKVVENHKVGWVKIRGSQDPIYIKTIMPHYSLYQEKIEDLKDMEDEALRKAAIALAVLELQIRTVTAAIVEWDEEFFEQKFTPEVALQIFKDENNILIYNQLANYMQKREDFLPIVSV